MATATVPDVKERPILFSGPMVKAILDDRKTQTRRVIDLSDKAVMSLDQRKLGWTCNPELARVGDVGKMVSSLVGKRTAHDSQQISVPARHPDDSHIPWEECGYERVYCPYGAPGGRLWVREAWSRDHQDFYPHFPIVYRADGYPADSDIEKGKIYSPEQKAWYPFKWRPSIHMRRTDSRIALEITGVRVERLHEISEDDAIAEGAQCAGFPAALTNRGAFGRLWQKINGEQSWNDNPWVWVVEFRKL